MSIPVRGMDPEVNNFEQVSCDGHQMSATGRVGPRGKEAGDKGREVPYHPTYVCHDACYVPTPPPKTDRCL